MLLDYLKLAYRAVQYNAEFENPWPVARASAFTKDGDFFEFFSVSFCHSLVQKKREVAKVVLLTYHRYFNQLITLRAWTLTIQYDQQKLDSVLNRCFLKICCFQKIAAVEMLSKNISTSFRTDQIIIEINLHLMIFQCNFIIIMLHVLNFINALISSYMYRSG